MLLLSSADFLKKFFECQTVWIQIRTDILSVLICVQTVCKGYQQTTYAFIVVNFFKTFFQEHYQSVKRFGSRSGPMFCLSWSGSKLFAKVIRRQMLFSKHAFRNTIRVSNGLDPDQDRHSVGPDLGPNCLQRLSLLLSSADFFQN